MDYKKNININLDDLINELSYEIKSNLLFILLSYRNNNSLNLNEFQNFYNSLLSSEGFSPQNTITSGILQTLNLFKAINLINFEYTKDKNYKIKINFFNKNFEELLLKYIPDENHINDSAQMKYFGWVYEFYNRNK